MWPARVGSLVADSGVVKTQRPRPAEENCMPQNPTTCAQIIARARAKGTGEVWNGRFIDYLERVRKDPGVARLAHARLYALVIGAGVRDDDGSDQRTPRLFGEERPKVYEFFKGEFFGIESSIAQIVRYLHSAALQGEESRQVLYLMGPVGAGKSSLVERLKRGLEEGGPFYAIDGCPMHEEPLHLIPHQLRTEFAKMLEVQIEG